MHQKFSRGSSDPPWICKEGGGGGIIDNPNLYLIIHLNKMYNKIYIFENENWYVGEKDEKGEYIAL